MKQYENSQFWFILFAFFLKKKQQLSAAISWAPIKISNERIKIQGLITMLAVLSQRYLLAIQGMKGTTNPDILPCCVLLHTYPSHIPPSKNRWRIFIMPVPSKKSFSYGNNQGHWFGSTAGFTGCRDRHYKISVVDQERFCVRGAFQAMQKWAMRI
jgi:hypothetical protein